MTNTAMPDASILADETATVPAGNGRAAALGAAGCLSLAAAPTFGLMAVVTGLSAPDPADVLCANGTGLLPLTGMLPMYLLMSAFHLGPWLKLLAHRRG